RSAGTTPQCSMKAPSAGSPPFARRPSCHANTTQQAMIRDSVTYGVRRVGLASRRGIMGRPDQGFLGFGVAFAGFADWLGAADWLGLADGAASGTATRIAWL